MTLQRKMAPEIIKSVTGSIWNQSYYNLDQKLMFLRHLFLENDVGGQFIIFSSGNGYKNDVSE